jgi:Calx-beta domain/PKD domain/Fibronectin type III domain
MNNNRIRTHYTYWVLLICIGLIALVSAANIFRGRAASPASGTISPSSPTTSYTGGPFNSINQTDTADTATIVCSPASPCDDYALAVSIPGGDTNTYIFTATMSWTDKATLDASHNDFDFFVYDSKGTLVSSSSGATSANPEKVTISVKDANYKIRVLPFDVNTGPSGDTYSMSVTLSPVPGAPAFPTPPPTVPGVPRYQNYAAPNGLGTTAGEPSIGVDWATGKVFIGSNLQTLRVTFDDCSSPAKATWEDKSAPSSQESLDPILFTDHNGLTRDRTFVSQLTGQDSLTSFTDDDGDNWTPSQGGGVPSGVDHQTIGGGPYRTDMAAIPPVIPPPHPSYPNVIYYCSQDVASSFCARSDNGGQTFGAGVPIWTINQCAGIHGHVKVAPDGTVYVPNKSCGGQQGFSMSRDNGVTWTVSTDPNSTATSKLVDPSVGIGQNGTVYFAYAAGADGSNSYPPRVAVAKVAANGTVTWSNDQQVGGNFNIKNAVFPEAISSAFNPSAVAGDDNRAAIAFLGSTAPGDYTNTSYTGSWHLFISTTLDGGVTWNTVDATPNDPVQRGSICTLGTTACVHVPDDRNLLDFMDMTIDRQGRVLVGYPDGCIGGCVNGTDNSFTRLASIARQSGGKRIISAFDPAEPVVPGAPLISVVSDPTGIHVTWPETDNGGAPITNYRVYRRPESSAQKTVIANVGTSLNFDDLTADPNIKYFYSVSAINSVGEGLTCGEVSATKLPAVDPCNLPGVSLVTDPTGDAKPPTSALDIQQVWIAEPFDANTPNTNKLTWTMKVASLATVPPNSQWYIIWDFGKGARRYVAMLTDGSGTPSFRYGHVGPALSPTSPDPAANKPFDDGAADSGTIAADGTIRIKISNSKVAECIPTDSTYATCSPSSNAPKGGNTIANISPRTFSGSGTTNVTGSSATDSTAATPSYTLIGNAFCRPQNAPVARLGASPVFGPAPLTVNFDGSGSFDPDAGDAIASYTFDFGDTFISQQSTPTVSHVYNSNGTYQAKLYVRDTRGKLSNTPATVTITVSAASAPTSVQFDNTSYGITEGVKSTTINATRTGPTTGSSTVDFTLSDGSAHQRGDFEYATGRLTFAPGDTQKSFVVLVNDDSYVEGTETATLTLSNPAGAVLGSASASLLITDNDSSAPSSNVIDDSRIFVGTHYHDFLNRQADQSGEDFWTNTIESCGADAPCRQVKRVNASTAFFLSIEFKETGFFVLRAHKSGFGSGKNVPRYTTFLRDQRQITNGVIVGQGNWQQQIDANKQAYLTDFVSRTEFTSQTEFAPGAPAATYVDKLFANNGVTPTTAERNAAISAYGSGDSAGRAAALKSVIESGSVFNVQYNPGFVLMQYYGYLRRNPDDAPDNNFSGYDFWLAKLNSVSQPGEDMRNDTQANARVQRAEMVRAFIESDEYRQRFFGSPTGNQFTSGDEGVMARFIKGVVRFALFGVSG